jgi:hypothetical protein
MALNALPNYSAESSPIVQMIDSLIEDRVNPRYNEPKEGWPHDDKPCRKILVPEAP